MRTDILQEILQRTDETRHTMAARRAADLMFSDVYIFHPNSGAQSLQTYLMSSEERDPTSQAIGSQLVQISEMQERFTVGMACT